jgi:uncharacterized integral membrane protein (TIGR00697 family)
MEKEEKKSLAKPYKYLGLITAIYITFQLVSNTTAGKIVQLGIFTIPAPVFFFPVTYIIADILTEVYGYAKARSVLWMVVISALIMALLYSIVVYLPPAIGFDSNDAYTKVLGQVPRIVFASLIAIFIGGIINDYTLAKMKVWTKGKHLWTRTISSTIVGEGADTVLFFLIALYGIIPTSLLISSILSGWLIKVGVEVVMTPVTYKVVAKLKKVEGEDYYDTNTNFNPLIIRN